MRQFAVVYDLHMRPFTLPTFAISIVLAASLAGCAEKTPSLESVRADNRAGLVDLWKGMPKGEVFRVMGTETVKSHSDVITNPYRMELYNAGEHVWEILFYYTDLKSADDAITDDEMTPLVLKDGVLDGWGGSYWNDVVAKYEVRV